MNDLLFLRVIDNSWRILAPSGVSTEAGDHQPPASVDVVREKIEKILADVRDGEAISWVLADNTKGAYLGTAGLWRWDKANFRAELGYTLSPSRWGQGLMPEAVKPMLAFGFERMKLHSVEATVHAENVGSMRVLEKLGFQKEGLLRECHWYNGVFESEVVYSLLATG